MQYFIKAFAALALVAVLTTAPAAPAWVDNRSDCVRASGDVGIAACTRLIADVVTGKLDVREAAEKLPEEVEEPKPFDGANAQIGAEKGSADALDAVYEEAEV